MMKFSVYFICVFILFNFNARNQIEGSLLSAMRYIGQSISNAFSKSYQHVGKAIGLFDEVPKQQTKLKKFFKSSFPKTAYEEKLLKNPSIPTSTKSYGNNEISFNLLEKPKTNYMPVSRSSKGSPLDEKLPNWITRYEQKEENINIMETPKESTNGRQPNSVEENVKVGKRTFNHLGNETTLNKRVLHDHKNREIKNKSNMGNRNGTNGFEVLKKAITNSNDNHMDNSKNDLKIPDEYPDPRRKTEKNSNLFVLMTESYSQKKSEDKVTKPYNLLKTEVNKSPSYSNKNLDYKMLSKTTDNIFQDDNRNIPLYSLIQEKTTKTQPRIFYKNGDKDRPTYPSMNLDYKEIKPNTLWVPEDKHSSTYPYNNVKNIVVGKKADNGDLDNYNINPMYSSIHHRNREPKPNYALITKDNYSPKYPTNNLENKGVRKKQYDGFQDNVHPNIVQETKEPKAINLLLAKDGYSSKYPNMNLENKVKKTTEKGDLFNFSIPSMSSTMYQENKELEKKPIKSVPDNFSIDSMSLTIHQEEKKVAQNPENLTTVNDMYYDYTMYETEPENCEPLTTEIQNKTVILKNDEAQKDNSNMYNYSNMSPFDV